MGRAAAYLISQHARGSIVNHLGRLTVTHQHISEQGHDTGTRRLSSSWQGRDQPSSHLYQRVLPACFCTCCLALETAKGWANQEVPAFVFLSVSEDNNPILKTKADMSRVAPAAQDLWNATNKLYFL